jgi:hypothetical protein
VPGEVRGPRPHRVTVADFTWRAWILYAAAVVLFLTGVGRFYDARTGFTSLIGFGDRSAAGALPAVRAIPHRVYRSSAGYDGQFYAQMALDPLLRDPATDRAMDEAPLRARRVLLSWTAFALGLGRPAWILQAYALQNVICWLALSALLLRWFPLTTARLSALWAAMSFAGGLMWSVRFALLDGPSLLLIALGMAALEGGRRWTSAAVFGVAGLARETNVLGIAALAEPHRWRDWRAVVRQAGLVALTVVPILVWFDYIRSIYHTRVLTSGETLSRPFEGALWRLQQVLEGVGHAGITRDAVLTLLVLAAVCTQIGWLIARPAWRDPWWRLGVAYALLMPFLGRPLWAGQPPTAMRVLLPLLLAFNVRLRLCERPIAFWALFVLGNAAVIHDIMLLRLV